MVFYKSKEDLDEFIYIATPTKEAVAEIDHEDESNDWSVEFTIFSIILGMAS